MPVNVKICGLKTPDTLKAALDGGASFVGFVFYGPSPRCILPGPAASLAALVPDEVAKVGLVVNADDVTLESILRKVPLDILQLHGEESLERVGEIKRAYGLEVMKAVAVAGLDDLRAARAYQGVADSLLFDAKAPHDADRPGGNAKAFDWDLLAGEEWEVPWMLAGGLNVENLAEAVKITGADVVDVSSGVEDAPGVKSVEKIRAFLSLADRL